MAILNNKSSEHGLGRIHVPDERDKNFPLRQLLPTEIKITHKAWYSNAWWGDQLDTPMCVGYSLAAWVEDGPIGHSGIPPIVKPEDIYNNAQKLDEFPGEDYDGTTVRAGAKYLQSIGYIQSYHWGANLQDAIDALLTLGPVVIGINWYEQMFDVNSKGFIKIGGDIAGGHAIKADAINVTDKWIRLKNSWGRNWGHVGYCYISFDDFARLISEDGECLLAIENAIVKV